MKLFDPVEGGLGKVATLEVLARRVAEVEIAVNAEAARWGDNGASSDENGGKGRYDHADWERETGWLRDTYMQQRGAVVQAQLARLFSRMATRHSCHERAV